jgi:hypothetical protein
MFHAFQEELNNMGFTKLDENILQSSIMAEDAETFKVWIALLASCKENGIAPVSIVYIASICKRSNEEVAESIKKLECPDVYSRSTNDEGRRIRRVDGGFEIINYQKYRSFTYSNNANAERQRRFREKNALRSVICNDVTESNGDISASVSSSSSLSSSLSLRGDCKGRFVKPTIPEIIAYCEERDNRVDAQQFFDHYESNGWKIGKSAMKNWRASVRTWEKNNYNNNGGTSGKGFQSNPGRFVGAFEKNIGGKYAKL